MTQSIDCPDCGAAMDLKRKPGRAYYRCSRSPACLGNHSAHTKTGEPMGYPADRETRAARRVFHKRLDGMWADALQRRECYARLASEMGIALDDCHAAKFSLAQCRRAIAIVNEWRRPKSKSAWPGFGAGKRTAPDGFGGLNASRTFRVRKLLEREAAIRLRHHLAMREAESR